VIGSPLDVAVGMSAMAGRTTVRASRRAGAAVRPVARTVLRPPVLPENRQPASWLGSWARRGAETRSALRYELATRLDVLVPAVLTEVLRRSRLTEMLLRYVDLDDVVAAVDLDRAASRLDVDAVVRRVDVGSVVDRVDVDDVVRRVDIDSIIDRVDVDAVARRLDLDAVLDRLDLTSLVLQRVDLETLVDAVLSRIDLAGLAEEVIDEVDLPEIIRESTGSMASDTVRGARMQGIAADEAVGRAVDRLLLRRGRRSTTAQADAAAPTGERTETTVPTQRDRP
jgi:hypothetical protein